ncbi:Clp protease ClpP [Psychrobacillus sp. Sa2BUA9]|uniref:ATP-dependent Clp protease proteolytic subunit n=1 Tax=Psychrobacillus faecigallinarum TaxID=2762235 RepID=A0ABR8RF17_9BACI|nr:head maturation protease, ClpP-related [Psychrobacillus faecigallinarum]MBD7946414.1 Clp protease ClpP [Psychrobacillus faecigallinarum]
MRGINRDDFYKIFKNQSHVEKLKEIPQKFNAVHDEEIKTSEITIYGVIGASWWNESFSANDIDEAIKAAGTNDIIINLNSPGGDAFDGIAIFNRLKRHEGKVTIHVDGWACSAASVIAMAADELIMELGSMFMYHEASNIVWGTKTEMRKEADILEELEEGIIDIYMTKTNLSREEVRANLDAETWISAKKAVEHGFADKAAGGTDEDPVEPINTIENKQQIMNELKNILKPNNQIQEPDPPSSTTSTVEDNGNGSFNLLKKWR